MKIALMTVAVLTCLNMSLFCTNNLVGHRIINGNYRFEVWIHVLVYRLVDDVSNPHFSLI